MQAWRLALACALSALCTSSRLAADDPFVAERVLDYKLDTQPALYMPTDVSVAPDGRVFLADGVNDRIVEFSPDGVFQSEIRTVGDQTLSRPIGIDVGRDGTLWIADTGNARILARAPDGSLARTLVPPDSDGPKPADITGVAVSADGKYVWMVDNQHHHLGRYGIADGAWTLMGGRGKELGQLHHPFSLALSSQGEAFVCDIINARVERFAAVRGSEKAIGDYGVDLGQLYRPKGVALDARGNVWISDSVTRVVQVFDPEGKIIDVVRDATGEPLHFETPMNIALDGEGNLYVTELTANRVRKLRVTATPNAAARSAPRNAPGGDAQVRSCTICHIDWMPEFAGGRATRLMAAPASTDEQPAVSRAETCMSCHDGSVVDSRSRVWRDHSHRGGVTPPEGMHVPLNLPLVNGKLACRTCHSAHAQSPAQDNISNAVFLRVDNVASELCKSCHADKARGPRAGTHPSGGMPWAVPQALIDAGAKPGPNEREITCQVCHAPHGAKRDHLLLTGAQSNRLCLDCHDRIRPGMFHDGAHTEHPIDEAIAGPLQIAGVRKLGTELGPKGELICLSCHKLHHGAGERFLLADKLTEGRMCLNCHSDHQSLLGTPHDLSAKFPDEKNRKGLTAASGGACSACHTMHGFARTPEPTPVDSDGKCVTCHQQGGIAESRLLGAISHPKVRCVICHDPHSTEQRFFLRESPEDLCLECHDQGDEMVGGHTFEGRAELVNAHGEKLDDVGSCLMCHSMHDGVAKPLWGASLEAPRNDREKCTICHQPGGLASAKPAKAFNHPLDCTECHNPHADADENPPLMKADPPVQNQCLTCHDEHETIEGGPHDVKQNPAVWPKVSTERGDRCLACHSPHADTKAKLFRNGLAANASEHDAACLACHPQVFWKSKHPFAALHSQNAADLDPDDEDFPLVAGAGEDEHSIGCRTCHNPHRGKGPPAKLVRAEDGETTADLCKYCHEDRDYITATGHSPASFAAAGLGGDACKPCHVVHGDPSKVQGNLLWGAPAADSSAFAPNQRCVGCHRNGGPAKPPRTIMHPDVAMRNSASPDEPGFLPLFNEQGEIDPNGRLACMTCHAVHGREPNPGGENPDLDTLSPAVQRAMRLELRPFKAPNLCTTCHGEEAQWRFLRFHDPKRRGGPSPRKKL